MPYGQCPFRSCVRVTFPCSTKRCRNCTSFCFYKKAADLPSAAFIYDIVEFRERHAYPVSRKTKTCASPFKGFCLMSARRNAMDGRSISPVVHRQSKRAIGLFLFFSRDCRKSLVSNDWRSRALESGSENILSSTVKATTVCAYSPMSDWFFSFATASMFSKCSILFLLFLKALGSALREPSRSSPRNPDPTIHWVSEYPSYRARWRSYPYPARANGLRRTPVPHG